MTFTTSDLKALFQAMSAKMAAERDALCALDGAIGDADHGIAMDQGMRAAALAASEQTGSFQDIFNSAAKAFLNSVGASSGPLYATAFMRAGKVLGPVSEVDAGALRQVIIAMRDGIQQRGKAEPGQKTMLDAWHPAAEASATGVSGAGIANAARSGADATCDMIATLGRAARLGDRSLGHPDPGAVSAALLIALLAEPIDG